MLYFLKLINPSKIAAEKYKFNSSKIAQIFNNDYFSIKGL